jgi:hypothetical protein
MDRDRILLGIAKAIRVFYAILQGLIQLFWPQWIFGANELVVSFPPDV